MASEFALSFTLDGMSLLRRTRTGDWRQLGQVAADSPARMTEMRALAQRVGRHTGGDTLVTLMMPASEMLFYTLPDPGGPEMARAAAVRDSLHGRTPYDPSELCHDWRSAGDALQVAVIARETVAEIRSLAEAAGFHVERIAAQPVPGAFDGEAGFSAPRATDDAPPQPEAVGSATPVAAPPRGQAAADAAEPPATAGADPAAAPPVADAPSSPAAASAEVKGKGDKRNRRAEEVPAPISFVSKRDGGPRPGARGTPSRGPVTLPPGRLSPVSGAPVRPAPAVATTAAPATSGWRPRFARGTAVAVDRSAETAEARDAAQQRLALVPQPDETAAPEIARASDSLRPEGDGLPAALPDADTERARLTLFGARSSDDEGQERDDTRRMRLVAAAAIGAVVVVGGLVALFSGGSDAPPVADPPAVVAGDPAPAPAPASGGISAPGALSVAGPASESAATRPVAAPPPVSAPPVVSAPESLAQTAPAPATGQPLPGLADAVPDALTQLALSQGLPAPAAPPSDSALAGLPGVQPLPGHDPRPAPPPVDARPGEVALPAPVGQARAPAAPDAAQPLVAQREGSPPVVPPSDRPDLSVIAARAPDAGTPRPRPRPASSAEAASDGGIVGPPPDGMLRPRPRPAQQDARRDPAVPGGADAVGVAVATGDAPRPRLRDLPAGTTDTTTGAATGPGAADAARIAVVGAARPVPLAVPRARPAELVARPAPAAPPPPAAAAPAPEPEPTPAPAVATPRDVPASREPSAASRAIATAPTGPILPVRAEVAARATEEDGVRLRRMSLIGVYGPQGARRALVRLGNGDYVKVEVGDELDGGRIAAIGEAAITYVRGGEAVRLAMPDGG